MKKLFLDFETYSEVDIRTQGASVYARHPSTEPLCLAYSVDGGPVGLWVPDGETLEDDHPELLAAALDEDVEFHAHNASFEIGIWRHVMVARFGWPEIKLKRWHCTAAKCAALSLPRSLDQAARVLGLDEQKDGDGHRVMMKLSKPRKASKHDPDTRWTPAKVPDDFAKLYAYCKQDVVTEMAVDDATPDLCVRERRTWLMDQIINERGVPVDEESRDACIARVAEYRKALVAQLRELTGGQVTSGTQLVRMQNWLIEQGVNISGLTAADVKEALAGDLPEDCRRVLEIRQVLSLSSVNKFKAMKDRADDDGLIRQTLLYFAARTGRWGGRGVQFQNVPGGKMGVAAVEALLDLVKSARTWQELWMWPMEFPKLLTGVLRSVVCARKGKKLVVCDFSGIEARVLAWLAGEKRLISLFELDLEADRLERSGGDPGRIQDLKNKADVYCSEASAIFEMKVTKANKFERQVGKIAVLGLGYGMGHKKYHETCQKFGVDIDPELAEKVVKTYRENNAGIKRLWYALDDAAREAVETGKPVSTHGVTYYTEGKWLYCRLPSGRNIAYFQPFLRTRDKCWGDKQELGYWGVNTYTNQWSEISTYGGKLCENVVQAIARDLLVDAIFRCEKKGYRTSFHVHDEIVAEVDESFGSINEMAEIMCELPKWADGCPVGAAGFEAKRYRKD